MTPAIRWADQRCERLSRAFAASDASAVRLSRQFAADAAAAARLAEFGRRVGIKAVDFQLVGIADQLGRLTGGQRQADRYAAVFRARGCRTR